MQRQLNFAPLSVDPGNIAQGDDGNRGTEELFIPQPEDHNIQDSPILQLLLFKIAMCQKLPNY